jgi:hypothetical protein
MPRHTAPTLEQPVWRNASAERPCPTCGRTEGCSELEGGEFVRCLTAVSPWPVAGGGWLHPLAAAAGGEPG